MITDYLLELLDELLVPRRRRRRILIEVEDHLACTAAELHGDGMDPDEAEQEAVRRFGPAAELGRSFVEQEAAFGARRAARASGLLAVTLALLLRRIVPAGAFPAALVAFMLAQVALVAGALTVVRAWRAAPEGGLRGPSLTLVLRGALVVVGCAGSTVAFSIVDALANGGSGTLPATWLASAGVAVGIVVTSAMLSRSWRLAGAAGVAAVSPGAPPDAVDDLQAASALALARLQRRLPTLRVVLGRRPQLVKTLSAALARRAPRLATWLDLRAHPWRFAASVAGAAGGALAGGHMFAEGLPTGQHAVGGLIAFGLIAGIEALAALLSFAVLGRFLGIRAARTQD